MSTIFIETTQNVTIEHHTAPISARLGAFAIDSAITIAYLIAVMVVISSLRIEQNFVFVLAFLPIVFYDFAFEVFLNGQSPGKMLVKIKVVSNDGEQTKLRQYFLRWLLRFVEITVSSGAVAILTILVNGKGQRLGDILAGTSVVSTKKIKPNHNFFTNFSSEYQISYPEVQLLTDADIRTIHEVMAFVENSRNKHSIDMAYMTKKKLEEKMGIQSNLPARKFFELILSDYTAYFSRLE